MIFIKKRDKLMNFRYFLAILTLIGSLTVQAYSEKELKNSGCQCYCSVLCGPRDPDQPGDAPFYNERYGMCFCAHRDEILYEPNKCASKKSKEFVSCCDVLD